MHTSRSVDGLVFTQLRNFDLVMGWCANSHLHIFGFPHQLKGDIDFATMSMTTTAKCLICGCDVTRTDRVMFDRSVVYDGLGI